MGCQRSRGGSSTRPGAHPSGRWGAAPGWLGVVMGGCASPLCEVLGCRMSRRRPGLGPSTPEALCESTERSARPLTSQSCSQSQCSSPDLTTFKARCPHALTIRRMGGWGQTGSSRGQAFYFLPSRCSRDRTWSPGSRAQADQARSQSSWDP